MLIRKTFQGSIPDNKIVNTYSESQTDTYSCDYINNSINEIAELQEDTGWIPVSFSGITYYSPYGGNYETPSVRKIGKVIYMKGLVNVSTTRDNYEDIVCNLPEGFAPPKRLYVTVATSCAEYDNGGHVGVLTIRPDGTIRTHNTYMKGWLSLDSIVYFID